MASKDNVAKKLAALEARIRRLESASGTPATKKHSPAQAASLNSLPDHILRLRDTRFFATPRTAEDVHKKLQPTYHCELNRVGVALSRLAERKKLRKASRKAGGRTLKAFVW